MIPAGLRALFLAVGSRGRLRRRNLLLASGHLRSPGAPPWHPPRPVTAASREAKRRSGWPHCHYSAVSQSIRETATAIGPRVVAERGHPCRRAHRAQLGVHCKQRPRVRGLDRTNRGAIGAIANHVVFGVQDHTVYANQIECRHLRFRFPSAPCRLRYPALSPGRTQTKTTDYLQSSMIPAGLRALFLAVGSRGRLRGGNLLFARGPLRSPALGQALHLRLGDRFRAPGPEVRTRRSPTLCRLVSQLVAPRVRRRTRSCSRRFAGARLRCRGAGT